MRWERGTAEKTDGLTRQYLSKQKSMEHLTQHDGNRIPAKLNNRPRKRLGYRTRRSAMLDYAQCCTANLISSSTADDLHVAGRLLFQMSR